MRPTRFTSRRRVNHSSTHLLKRSIGPITDPSEGVSIRLSVALERQGQPPRRTADLQSTDATDRGSASSRGAEASWARG